MEQPPPEVQAAARAALALAAEGKITLPRGSKRKHKRNASGPKPGSHEYKAVHGTRQTMATNRQRRRNQGGVIHIDRVWKLSDAERQIMSEIQRKGKK